MNPSYANNDGEAPSHGESGDPSTANVSWEPRQGNGHELQHGVKREREEDENLQQHTGSAAALPLAAGGGVGGGGGAGSGGSETAAAAMADAPLLDPVLVEEEKAQVLDQARAVNGMIRINNMTWWTTDAEVQAMAAEFGPVVSLVRCLKSKQSNVKVVQRLNPSMLTALICMDRTLI